MTAVYKLARRINNAPPIFGTVRVTRLSKYTYRWHEDILTPLPDGSQISGTQAYDITFTPLHISISFATGPQTGDIFQVFPRKSGSAESVHHCGNDIYHTRLIRRNLIDFHVEHSVKGPQKDYIMRTHYRAESNA